MNFMKVLNKKKPFRNSKRLQNMRFLTNLSDYAKSSKLAPVGKIEKVSDKNSIVGVGFKSIDPTKVFLSIVSDELLESSIIILNADKPL